MFRKGMSPVWALRVKGVAGSWVAPKFTMGEVHVKHWVQAEVRVVTVAALERVMVKQLVPPVVEASEGHAEVAAGPATLVT